MEADTLEEQLLVYAKEGICSHIQRLLQLRIDQISSFNINCRCKFKKKKKKKMLLPAILTLGEFIFLCCHCSQM